MGFGQDRPLRPPRANAPASNFATQICAPVHLLRASKFVGWCKGADRKPAQLLCTAETSSAPIFKSLRFPALISGQIRREHRKSKDERTVTTARLA